MGDKDDGGWPQIEPLPKLPAPKPRHDPAPPPPTAPPSVPVAPPPPSGHPYPPSGQPSNATAWWVTGMLSVVVVLVIAVGVAASASDSDDGDEGSAPATTDDVTPRAPVADIETTTTTAPTTTTTSTTAPPPPPPPLPGFDNGTFVVGQDIQPGLYMSSGGFTCYWERRSGVDNGFDGLLANGGGGPAVVEIRESDVAFMSRGCERWVDYVAPPEPLTSFGDGSWVVGEQVAPGTYRVESPTGACTWERANGFTHDFDRAIDYSFEVAAGDTVRINAGERFTTSLCGAWVPA